jgi:hypothetical protein
VVQSYKILTPLEVSNDGLDHKIDSYRMGLLLTGALFAVLLLGEKNEKIKKSLSKKRQARG